MSTTIPPPTQSSEPGAAPAVSSDIDRLIEQRIVQACKALWWAELTRSALKLVIASIAILLAWVVVDQWIYSPGPLFRWVIFVTLALVGLRYLATRVLPLLGRTIRPEYAARSLERDFPELRQSLTSYVSLRGDRVGSTLRHRVVRSIGAASAGYLRTHDELPSEAAGSFRWWIGTAVALALLMAYAVVSPKNSFQSAARLAAPFAAIDPAMRVSITEVQPGDSIAVAGRTVAVSAKIDGLRDDEPALVRWRRSDSTGQVVLEFDNQTRRYHAQLPLAYSDAGAIPYTIEAGDDSAGPFELNVQDVPVVAIESVHYDPPKYTGQAPWTISGGAINAIEGTQVTISAATNRPVVKARIEFNPRVLGDSVQATAGDPEMAIADNGTALTVSFPLRGARGRSAAVELESYRISVWDATEQRNPEPIVYPIRVATDLPPELAITLPTKSPKELPIDSQQVIEIHASDPDFGLRQISLEIRSGIDLMQPVLWSDDIGAKGNRIVEYRLRPSEHGFRVGDTVNVIAVATDNRVLDHDPSVKPNTTRTDAIEFKIVASQPPPRQDDPEADGVSAADERPASDQGEQNSGSDNAEGQKQQADGGGSGGEGQPQSSESPAEDGSSAGTSGSGKQQAQPGESAAEDSGGQSEPSESDPTSDAGSNAGSDAATDPNQSGPQRADNRQADQPSDPAQQAAPQQPDNSESGTSAEGKPGGDPNQPLDQSQSSESSGGPSDNRPPGSNGDLNSPGEGEAGQNKDQQRSGEPGQAQEASEAPQHDGEAFEKIRQHLEEQRKTKPQASETPGQRNSDQGSRDQGSRDQGSQSPEAVDQPAAPDTSDASESAGESGREDQGQQGAGGQQQAGDQSEQAGDQSEQPGDQQGDTATGPQGASSTDGSEANSEPGKSKGDQGQQTETSAGNRNGRPIQSGARR